MKYCYVISTDGQDLYIEQLYLSVRSLLLHNPSADVCVLCDDLSKSHIVSSRWSPCDMISELITVHLDPDLSTKVKSRLLKTSVREYMTGDFLYIDSDTVIVDILDFIEKIQSIGAVYNTHSESLLKSPNLDAFSFYLNLINESITLHEQFNGGVIFVRDTEQAYLFFKHWHNLYFSFYKQYGIDFDQLSLYLANCRMGGLIQPVNGIWNCQLRYGINYVRDAKILHFLTTTSLTGKHQAPIHILQDSHFYLKMRNELMSKDAIDDVLLHVMSEFTPLTRIKTSEVNNNLNISELLKEYGKEFIVYDDYHDEVAYKAFVDLDISVVSIWNHPSQIDTNVSFPVIVICSTDRVNIMLSVMLGKGINKFLFYYH